MLQQQAKGLLSATIPQNFLFIPSFWCKVTGMSTFTIVTTTLLITGLLRRSSAGVTCRASESGGVCEVLSASHWCKNEEGIGCIIATGQVPVGGTEGAGTEPSSCILSNCPSASSGSSDSGPLPPRNLTVVASPSLSSSKFYADLLVQWEAPLHDSSTSGYEVVVLRNDEAVWCVCLHEPDVRHVFVTNIYIRNSYPISVKVIRRPYNATTRAGQTASVVVKQMGARRNCWASAASQNCLSPGHSMLYSLVESVAVQVEVSDYTNHSHQLMRARLSWDAARRGPDVVIALDDHTHLSSAGSVSCTAPNRTIPCFLTTATNVVELEGLSASLNYTATIYEFNSTLCHGLNPSHLFSGCGQHCCNSPVSIISPRYLPPAAPTSDGILPTSLATQLVTIVEKHNYFILIVSMVMVGLAVIGTVGTILVILASRSRVKSRTEVVVEECVAANNHKMKLRKDCISLGNHPLLASCSSSSTTPSPLPANEVISLHQFAATSAPNLVATSHPFTRHSSEPAISTTSSSPSPTQNAVTLPPTPPSLTTEQSRPPHPLATPPTQPEKLDSPSLQYANKEEAQSPEILAGSVLIIYSPSISSSDREKILKHLIVGLTQYGIPAHCHDTAFIKSPCQWMEQEIQKAHAVLCVCNEDFHREWDEGTAKGKIPVVGLLKHLIHAMLSRGESLGKFATVLLDEEDAHWIPSLYLQGDPRLFLVSKVEDIARFVRNIPSYAPPAMPASL